MIRVVVSSIFVLAVVATVIWACAALWIDGPDFRVFAGALVVAYVLATAVVFLRVRSISRGVLLYTVLFATVLGWWLNIPPSNGRSWQPDVAQLANAQISGDILTINNVREFEYQTENDFDERWVSRSYDLSKIRGIDLFKSHWASPMIAHTFVSWVFEDGPPLTISIEARREANESYSALRGFFRQFELYYVVSSEIDVARLRTNFRDEDVYLYRLRSSPNEARALLVEYMNAVNDLYRKPAWYNALFHNCTTAIWEHVRHVVPTRWDWRILVNGYLDEAGYESGAINNSIPFDKLRSRSLINPRALAAGVSDYSQRIRVGLPARPKAY